MARGIKINGIQWDLAHYRRIGRYAALVDEIYRKAASEAARIGAGLQINPQKPFSFDQFPQTKARVDKLFADMARDMNLVIEQGMREEWLQAAKKNDEFVNYIFRNSRVPREAIEKYFNRNLEGLAAFQKRKVRGLGLSDRVWKYTRQFKNEIELGLDVGIGEGRSAQQISRDLRGYLQNPDKLFRRVRDKYGNLQLSKAAKAYHPGRGVYRSSYKNAMRLARTETNMAYRMSDHERWMQLDFVRGIEVRLSHSHPMPDICDDLKGFYPKNFIFRGWHAQCYDEESEVLTNSGWKYFKDVKETDKILSLNPENKGLEWVGIAINISRKHTGDMIWFHNKTLDVLVTPEHEMVYLNKRDGSIMKRQAHEYDMNKGGFYRSSEYSAPDRDCIKIGSSTFDFDAFCEFMGYWLSDGSVIRNYQIFIAQKEGDPNRANIEHCIKRLGLDPKPVKNGINCYSKDLTSYLKQFGVSYKKYIPDVIKNSSPRQIKIFLDAFISCDGYIKKPKGFVGSRGSYCISKEGQRTYFTTSEQMAADIGELIVKIGKRPSYNTDYTKGKRQEFRNGTYTINHNSLRISECNGKTATVFEKEIVQYDGMVYDLTLTKNHIMYIRRKGKCFWGSNCLCHAIPVMLTDEEFDQFERAMLNGEDVSKFKSSQDIKTVPRGFVDWIEGNKDRVRNWKSQPFFVRDNFKRGRIENGLRILAGSEPNPISFVPDMLEAYEEDQGVKINREIFSLLTHKIPFERKAAPSAAYNFQDDFVNIPRLPDYKLSKWKSESVIYHEFGHAADWHHNLKDRSDVKALMNKYRKQLSQNRNEGYKRINEKLWELGERYYIENKHDLMNMTGAAHDTLKALNKHFGAGHSEEYFSQKGFSEAEFIAHMFENKYLGNQVFKETMPDLYKEMIELAEKIIAEIKQK